MKKMLSLLVIVFALFVLVGCFETTQTETQKDIDSTFKLGDDLAKNQPTPTDVNYSLERFNLIKRTYWVNGQREKALSLQSSTPLPLGYIVLFQGNTVVAQFTVLGKVSSLNSWLTPDYWYKNVDGYTSNGAGWEMVEMPDVDGTYGTNSEGIFFFTPDGKYIEWTGVYFYTDYYISIDNPVITIITEGE